MVIILIAIAVLTIVTIIKFVHAKHHTKQVINFYDGTIGSGKTFLGTKGVIQSFKMARLMYRLHIIKAEPRIYSNIPLYVDKKTDVYVLKREHLLLKERFPKNICPFVFIDELSMIASCYGWDDPNFSSRNLNENMETLDTFIRFFRHFYGRNNNDMLRLYLTDQATGSVNIQIRRRLGYVNYLYNFRRYLGIMPFYLIDTKEMIVEEDTVNENNVDLQEKDRQYYMGRLPYRFISKLFKKRNRYDSHCFSEVLETHNFVNRLPYDIWDKNVMTTNYCPDLRMTDKERHEFNELNKKLKLTAKVQYNNKPF